jgi:fructose/tagatose bisphosphate aldolase
MDICGFDSTSKELIKQLFEGVCKPNIDKDVQLAVISFGKQLHKFKLEKKVLGTQAMLLKDVVSKVTDPNRDLGRLINNIEELTDNIMEEEIDG